MSRAARDRGLGDIEHYCADCGCFYAPGDHLCVPYVPRYRREQAAARLIEARKTPDMHARAQAASDYRQAGGCSIDFDAISADARRGATLRLV